MANSKKNSMKQKLPLQNSTTIAYYHALKATLKPCSSQQNLYCKLSRKNSLSTTSSFLCYALQNPRFVARIFPLTHQPHNTLRKPLFIRYTAFIKNNNTPKDDA